MGTAGQRPSTKSAGCTALNFVLPGYRISNASPYEYDADNSHGREQAGLLTYGTRLALQRLQQIDTRSTPLAEYRKASGAVHHKCFISYHAEDAEEVLDFVEQYDSIHIPKCIGISDDDPWVDSDDTDYIMDRVREKYLSDSTVTIVMVGECTSARKYVDWEVYSSLRRDKVNRLNGLLAVELKSVGGTSKLPARVADNVLRDDENADTGYARYIAYPSSCTILRTYIDDAFDARSSRSDLIDNTRARRKINGAC